eukprot:Skav203020  [mRNA]  locus=scaffold583:282345:282701:- [translate_table: standard]
MKAYPFICIDLLTQQRFFLFCKLIAVDAHGNLTDAPESLFTTDDGRPGLRRITAQRTNRPVPSEGHLLIVGPRVHFGGRNVVGRHGELGEQRREVPRIWSQCRQGPYGGEELGANNGR